MRRRPVLGIFAALAVGAAVVPWAAAGPAAAAAGGYAALGDSYTSAPLVPTQGLAVPGCLQSDHNYPHLVAGAAGLALADASCSGATTADLYAPQSTTLGTNPPQLQAVSGTDGLVTLGMGGNDIGFASIIQACAALTPFGPTSVGLTCKSHYDAGGVDQIGAAIAALEPRIVAALGAIHARAPQARVLVVGYPAILPPTGLGCWPTMPLTYTDVPYLRGEELALDAALAKAAAAGGATYVDTYTSSVGHSSCTPEGTRWVEPIVPTAPAYPVHPNAAGERAMAADVEAVLAGG